MIASPSSSGGGVGSLFFPFFVLPERLSGVGTSSGSFSLLCWPFVALPDRRVLSVTEQC